MSTCTVFTEFFSVYCNLHGIWPLFSFPKKQPFETGWIGKEWLAQINPSAPCSNKTWNSVFFNTTLAFLSFYAAFSFFLWLLFPKMVTSNTGCFRIRNAIGAKTKFKMADCQFAAIRSAKQGWEEISGGHRNLDPQIVYLHITIPNVLMTWAATFNTVVKITLNRQQLWVLMANCQKVTWRL